MDNVFRSVEKANCHIHITGSLNPPELRSIARQTSFSVEQYEPLEDYLDFEHPNIWAAAKELTSTPEGLLLATASILDHEAADNVKYIELTVNPYGMIRRGMELDEIVAMLTIAASYGKSIGIDAKIKYGVNRKDGVDSIREVRKLYEATPEYLRHSIDLNGDELTYPTSEFIEEFRQLAAEGVHTSIHAGEFKHLKESLSLAIEANPARIVHAVSCDTDMVREVAARGIVIEVSTTSSLGRCAVSTLAESPLPLFLEHDVPVVFGTDDPAFFDNTMTTELSTLLQVGLTIEEVLTLNHSILDNLYNEKGDGHETN